ncbi:MAG TPA: hypothetical protein VGV13_16625 [Methylomirabilota bacterium]|nr:hypothetical protein [Methylomirabilota bacterium]
MLQGLLLIALAAVSWGTTGSVTAVLVARADAHPPLIGAARLAVAAVLLLLGARLITGALAIARADLPRCLAITGWPPPGAGIGGRGRHPLEPLTATLLGMFLFGERLGGAGITGVALLLTAIVLLLGDRTR